jgi:peptidylprolyl isomerase
MNDFLPPLSRRLIMGLAGLSAAAAIAGCGSSKSNEIGVGQESVPSSIAKSVEKEAANAEKTGTTPKTGPLASKPTVTVPKGAAPTKLETKEIVTGTGAVAASGDAVTVNYVGVLFKDGKEFDSSWKRSEPFSFTLGEGQVIPGWDQGVAGMRVGGRRELIIPAALAYKTTARPGIPANSALVFVVDLLSA